MLPALASASLGAWVLLAERHGRAAGLGFRLAREDEEETEALPAGAHAIEEIKDVGRVDTATDDVCEG